MELCKKYHNDIVDFYEYSNRSNGNYIIQVTDEKLYLIWEYKLRPVLSFIKHKIFKK